MSVKMEQMLQVFAGTTSRKELDKEMGKIRKEFANAKAVYDSSYAQLNALQAKVDSAQQKMQEARQALINISSQIQMMDLTGANATRDRGDVRTYLVDGKEYHAEKSEDGNDVNMVLWKEFKLKKLDSKKEKSEEDTDDDCIDFDDCGDFVVSAYKDVLTLIKR